MEVDGTNDSFLSAKELCECSNLGLGGSRGTTVGFAPRNATESSLSKVIVPIATLCG